MRTLVTGGTGVLGRAAVPLLVAAGHDVVVTVRSSASANRVAVAGATPLDLDVWDEPGLHDAVRRLRPDVVIRLSTAVPGGARAAVPRAWRVNDRLRSELARSLAAAANAVGARYVGESVAFAYEDRRRQPIDERVPLAPAAHLRSVADTEAVVAGMNAAGGDAVSLRFGLFLGPGTELTPAMLSAARHGRLAVPGRLEDHVPFVHVDDAAAAVVAALDAAPGAYNVVEDDPATRGAHAEALGRVVGRRVRAAPAVLSLSPVVRALCRSQRVSNARLRDVGWVPSHRALDEWSHAARSVDHAR